MNKNVKNIIMVVVIILILFAIIWLGYDMLKSKPANTDVDTNLADENTGLDNVINNLFDNVVTEDIVDGNDVQSENIEEQTNSVSTESITSKEARAIELVKKQWGSSDGVYFSNDSIDEAGRYIVSVHDSRTTGALAFYLVDVDKGLVTEQ